MKVRIILPILLFCLATLAIGFYAGQTSTIQSATFSEPLIYGDQICVAVNGVKLGCKVNENTFTNAGKNHTRDCVFQNTTGCATNYMALGNGTAVAATDTTLNSEITICGLARAAGTYSVETASNGNATYSKTWTYSCSSAMIINTTAFFNASATGTMFSGGTLTTATLSVSGDQLTVNYTRWFA